jgi:hypothetical protein
MTRMTLIRIAVLDANAQMVYVSSAIYSLHWTKPRLHRA